MTDAGLCALAAASYAAAPDGLIIDWRDCRMVVTGTVATIRGTVPDNWRNWLRDFRVGGALCRTHADVGTCPAGALDAAMALAELIPPEVDTLTGHSLGGQVAAIMAGLLVASGQPIRLLVTWDAPKAGASELAAVLAGTEARQYRFRGSVVTDWPLFLDRHVREPLIAIGDWTPDSVAAHGIARAAAWLAAQSDMSDNLSAGVSTPRSGTGAAAA